MSGYPEAISGPDLCYMEGCYWSGGVCTRCGTQLRCYCGQFVTEEKLEQHLDTACPKTLAYYKAIAARRRPRPRPGGTQCAMTTHSSSPRM